jgi:hypothetical protein
MVLSFSSCKTGNVTDYLQAASDNELAFRLILDKKGIDSKDMSLEELFKKYSEGDRYGLFTILKFEKISPTTFEFTHEKIAVLSRIGRAELWRVEDGEANFIEIISVWVS